jgi:hypothetical protein
MEQLSLRTIILIGLLVLAIAEAGNKPYIESVHICGTRRPLDVETRAWQTLDLDRLDRDMLHLKTSWATMRKVGTLGSAAAANWLLMMIQFSSKFTYLIVLREG